MDNDELKELYTKILYQDMLDLDDDGARYALQDLIGDEIDRLRRTEKSKEAKMKLWEVIKELTEDPKKKGEYQPVTWQEAIQAWVEGKTVTVLTLFGLGSREVKKSRGSSITEYEITNGVWYVED